MKAIAHETVALAALDPSETIDTDGRAVSTHADDRPLIDPSRL